MKKEIVRLLALLIFGAAALTGCSIDNHGRRGRYDNDRRYDNHHRYRAQNDHYYNNGRY